MECTCHISNLKCKNEKCLLLITARGTFKAEVSNMLRFIMNRLEQQGFTKKECVRALRRELNHKNKVQYDLFDETAEIVWGKDEQNTNAAS